jgi:hypothetical protein
MKCIGYTPVENFTIFVPDKILIDNEDEVILKSHYSQESISKAKLVYITASEGIKIIDAIEINKNEWLVIDNSKIDIIKISELESWKSKKSEELSQKIIEYKSSPLAVILLAENAIYLKNINFDQLIEGLSSARSSEHEPLSEVLQRLAHQERPYNP